MSDNESLKSFRRNAVHVRQALDALTVESSRVRVEDGYLQNEGLIERYKHLSIPVRRALNANDRASFAQALAVLRQSEATDAMQTVEAEWTRLQREFEGSVGLGGRQMPRREILTAWLEAAAFFDQLDRDRAYDRFIDQWGRAAENIGSQLMEDAARVILQLDEVAAASLGEPVILPPPVKTPPPPPDPADRWWKKLFG
jgi:hypothetical protein